MADISPWRTIPTLGPFRVYAALPLARVLVSSPDISVTSMRRVIEQVCGREASTRAGFEPHGDKDPGEREDTYVVHLLLKRDVWKLMEEKVRVPTRIPSGWRLELIVPADLDLSNPRLGETSVERWALRDALVDHSDKDALVVVEKVPSGIMSAYVRSMVASAGVPEALDPKYVSVLEVRREDSTSIGAFVVALGEAHRARAVVQQWSRMVRGEARLVGRDDWW